MSIHLRNFYRHILQLLILVVILAGCGPATAPKTEVAVQPPEATPTLEPTFTPLAAPTVSLSPVSTPTSEPTPTTQPQVTLSGRILEQDSAQPVADALVRAETASATTDVDGRYTMTDLPPGQYVLSVTHADYDPGLSSILTVAAGEDLVVDVPLYAPNTSPYPEDPMLTNPLDPNGAPTEEDAERLAREQGFTGEVVSIRETKLSGEMLVNYKIGDDIRAAVALVRHEAWELVDEAGREWWIIKVCGNLASRLPEKAPITTPAPKPLPPMAEVLVDELLMRECAAENCGEVGSVPGGERVEVFGCLAREIGSWCEVGWSGVRGWCTGQSLRQLAVVTVIPEVTPVLPTPTPGVVEAGGGKIAFTCKRGDDYSLYVINADGSNLTLLSDNVAPSWIQPAWSPDGRKIAFASPQTGNSEIYVINTNGSNLTRLTFNPFDNPLSDTHPTWSPLGDQIAFVSYGKGEFDGGIFTINVDGSDLTRLTDMGRSTGESWLNYWNPRWSPDGQRISFEAQPDLRRIYVVNADGSGLVQLTTDGIDGWEPKWSPDGQKIMFRSFSGGSSVNCGDREGYLAGMYLISSDGSALKPFTPSGTRVWSAEWSPDGQQIVFSSELGDPNHPNCYCNVDCNSEIYVIGIDGNSLTRLTNNPSGESDPIWSPDGSQIAFVSGRDGGGLYVMNSDGSNQTRLTNVCDEPHQPVWSP